MTHTELHELRNNFTSFSQLQPLFDVLYLQLSLDAARLMPPSPEFLIEHGFHLAMTDRGTSRYIIENDDDIHISSDSHGDRLWFRNRLLSARATRGDVLDLMRLTRN